MIKQKFALKRLSCPLIWVSRPLPVYSTLFVPGRIAGIAANSAGISSAS